MICRQARLGIPPLLMSDASLGVTNPGYRPGDTATALPAGIAARIAVIGGHAQVGVPTGCDSSAVVPPGGFAEVIKVGGPGIMGVGRNLYLLPSSPLEELRQLLPGAQIEFDPGMNPAESALMAAHRDVAVVFAIKLDSEGFDDPDLSLPWGQDAVIEAVAAANPNTIVVLETGNPVAMPWRDRVNAIVEAWYPGQAGGQAIAEILTGVVNPSGRLPVTFPADLAQTPRPDLPGLGTPWGTPVTIEYNEGAEIGYRWFAQQHQQPLYAFGHGLSYTTFDYSDLQVEGGDTVTAALTVTNTGDRAGADVPQLYLTPLGRGTPAPARFPASGTAARRVTPDDDHGRPAATGTIRGTRRHRRELAHRRGYLPRRGRQIRRRLRAHGRRRHDGATIRKLNPGRQRRRPPDRVLLGTGRAALVRHRAGSWAPGAETPHPSPGPSRVGGLGSAGGAACRRRA
jgi:hypothetical protein